ncbi:MAG: hypothetical protein KR126chlam6_01132 [Candidatus Anoxychlamydiales bacterium]|nr:hypothetical protein [Candidatus Anoxychlamydiales bacterium]
MRKIKYAIIFFLIFGLQLCYAKPSISTFSIRKSGTHMLTRLLELLEIPHRLNHLLYLDEFNEFLANPNLKGIVLIRDPRDVCVSSVFWHSPPRGIQGGLPLNEKDMQHLDPDQLNIWNESSFEKRLSIMIGHNFPLPYSQVNLEYELAKKALKNNNFFLIRFEDLVGERGGGSDEKQYSTIKKLLLFLKMDIPEEKIKFAMNQLYGSSLSFRKGIIGDWKNYFTSEHIALFKKKMNHTLLEWNYEDKWDWD